MTFSAIIYLSPAYKAFRYRPSRFNPHPVSSHIGVNHTFSHIIIRWWCARLGKNYLY